MKRYILIGLLSACLGGMNTLSYAHCGSCGKGDKAKCGAECTMKGHGHGEMDLDKKIEKMKKRLDLTDDQAAKIKKIKEEKHEKISALMEKTHAEKKAIKDDASTQIEAVLNDKQKAEYKKMKEEWMDKGDKKDKKGKKDKKKDKK